jgi:hypothetical protein
MTSVRPYRYYERSNLARRGDTWPNRASRIAQVRDRLRHPETGLFVVFDGLTPVAMAVAQPLRADDGAGVVVQGASFLNLIFVAPQR